MAAEETPAAPSSSSGRALQLEDHIGDRLNKPCRNETLEWLSAIDDSEGEYSVQLASHYDGQNAPVPESANVRQTGDSIEQSVQILEQIPERDRGSYFYNFEDDLEDYTMNDDNVSDEDDEVDEKSSDQNISVLGTKATDIAESATLSEERLQQDFSPTATTPNDISVSKVTTSSFESLQKPEKVKKKGGSVDVDPTSSQIVQNPCVGTEVAIQTEGDGNIPVTAQDKEDEENGGRILDKLKQVEADTDKKFVSLFDAVKDRPAPGTGVTSPTTPNDVRLAVPSLEPLAKRAKVNEDEILVNVERASSSSSAARP